MISTSDMNMVSHDLQPRKDEGITFGPPNPGSGQKPPVKPPAPKPDKPKQAPATFGPPNPGSGQKPPVRPPAPKPDKPKRVPVAFGPPNPGSGQKPPVRPPAPKPDKPKRILVTFGPPNPGSGQKPPVRPPANPPKPKKATAALVSESEATKWVIKQQASRDVVFDAILRNLLMALKIDDKLIGLTDKSGLKTNNTIAETCIPSRLVAHDIIVH